MASASSDSLPSSATASASAFLDPTATSFLFPTTAAQEPQQPDPPAAAARKPPRKRPRASRRPPTTLFTTDASNFRAMVQEFTGFPVPPFAPHLGPGVLFGAGPSPTNSAAVAGAPFQLLRPSPLKLPAPPHSSHPTCTTGSNTSPFANSNVNPTFAAVAPSSSSELYSGFGPPLAGAVPCYEDGFEAAEGESVSHGHGLFSSFLYAGDRYHSH
ncbi:VQ motif-containing protein 22-like [Phragmites australis]|uniref:VQ motif-containing protein 22-like n=1 Tax=Phragmites australis TaxID=29695 RepID=UPI002D78A93D|nr:VQ motif-containing protein 22-like [Phragmites australis]